VVGRLEVGLGVGETVVDRDKKGQLSNLLNSARACQ
jgi:hypothetical protein